MVLKPFYTPPRRAMTVHQAIRLARAAAAAAGRERGELAPLPRKTRIIPTRKVRPHRDSKWFETKLHFQTAARPSRSKRSRFLQLRLSSLVHRSRARILRSPAVLETFWRPPQSSALLRSETRGNYAVSHRASLASAQVSRCQGIEMRWGSWTTSRPISRRKYLKQTKLSV